MDADYGNAGDEALVQACLAGAPAAVEALVVRYTNAAFAVALSRLGSRQDAEDVTQETFVAAIRTLHRLKDPSRVGAWLCGIARHKALNWSVRWRRPGTVSWEALPAGAGPVDGSGGAVDAIAAAELRSTVRSAIGGLAPLQREAVVLHYVGGYGVGEMAHVLGVPLGTVKRRLHDARQRLKRELWTMAADELRKSGPSVDLGARIQEALEESGRARRGDLHADSLRRSEEALGLIATLPEGRDRTELEVLALHIKAQAVTFPVGGEEAIAIEEQVLALLEGLGDKRRVAAHLNELGCRYSNNRAMKRATEAHQRALELFAEVRDERGQGESLMWLAHLHLHDMADPVRALEHLEKARPLLHAGQDPALEAVCVADIRALRASRFADGTAGGELVAYSATADVFQTGSEGVRFLSQPGFIISPGRDSHLREGAFGIDVLQSAAQAKIVMDDRWRAGDTWQTPAFSYTMRPLALTATVVADDEALTVPAACFDRCLHLHLHIAPDPDDDGSEFNRELNRRFNCGDKHIWYVRGVGLVRLTFNSLDGSRADIQLTNYHVSGDADTHLPLAVGNRWAYKAMGFDAGYAHQTAYEVMATVDDRHYLAQWGYAVRMSEARAPGQAEVKA